MYASRTRGGRRAARRLLAIAALSVGVLAGSSVSASAAVTATFTSTGTLSVFGDSLNNTSRSAAMRPARSWSTAVRSPSPAARPRSPTPRRSRSSARAARDVLTLSEVNGALPLAHLFGGDGNDVLTGGSGADQLFGQTGNDTLLGKGGADLLFGGNENDTLTGGDADDQAFGQSGNDRMVWNPGDDTDLNEGGVGTDTVEVNGGNGARAVHDHGQRHPRPVRPPQPGAVRDRHRHLREPRPQRQRRRRQLLGDREPRRAHLHDR